jgi:hypothetical protein
MAGVVFFMARLSSCQANHRPLQNDQADQLEEVHGLLPTNN